MKEYVGKYLHELGKDFLGDKNFHKRKSNNKMNAIKLRTSLLSKVIIKKMERS